MQTYHKAPALNIDAILGQPSARGRIERAVVWNLLAHLRSNGWEAWSIDDGDEETDVRTDKEAMELIFNLDMAHVYFRHDDATHWVMLVLGNGIDVVSDWSYAKEDKDGFNAAMEAFSAENVIAGMLGAG